MTTFSIWFSILLSHEYYVKRSCPLSLIPSEQTEKFFKRRTLLFLHQDANKWLVLKDADCPVEELSDVDFPFLSLGLRPAEKEFYYVSGAIKENHLFTVTEQKSPGDWKVLEISTDLLIREKAEEVRIEIESVRKFQEYILIPKYQRADTKIKLVEEREKIRFRETGKVLLPGISGALRFVTEEEVKLVQGNDFKIQLWEIRENGERLISECVPAPAPDACSVLDPKNFLTSYFYY